MKYRHLFLIMLTMQSVSCGNSNAGSKEGSAANDQNAQADQPNTADPKIVGNWILHYIADDANNNQQLDKAEMDGAVRHWGHSGDEKKSVLQLKANGESLFTATNVKTGAVEQTEKGTWKLKQEGAHQMLYQYSNNKNFEPGKAWIIKLDGQELQWVYVEGLLPGMIYIYKKEGR